MPKRLTWTLFCLFLLLTSRAQDVLHLRFEEQTGSASVTDEVSGDAFSIQNNFGRPERIGAPFGKALRLDGWSTFITRSNFTLEGITTQMTIETWYATEAFNRESSALVELTAENSGFYLSVGAFGELNFGYHLDGQFRVHNTPKRLLPYQWHHIVATIDLAAGETNIYVDGEVWYRASGLEAQQISVPTGTLYVGRRSLDQRANGFLVNVLNGAIDELKISTEALSAVEVAARSGQVTERKADLTIDPAVRHQGDHLRPQYHSMPNTSWTNEPYGLMHYNGKYHLFFQKNPNAPQLYFMHWGHLTSPDLVHWQEEEIPLRPSDGFDSFGVWSGTTIKDPNGKPVIFYTGVDGARAGIGSAFFEDENLIRWSENPNNPLIAAPPASFSHKDFRDPYLWESDGMYYMIIGSGLNNNGGGILFTYKSADLENWTLIPRLYANNDLETYGEFWEMSTFHRIAGDTWMLQILPTPFQGKPARSIYLLGTWKNEVFTPFTHTPKSVELFDSHMLAPAFGVDEETRNVYIGIIPEDRDVNAQVSAGWRQTFSLPRQVRLLQDSTIGQIPHPNLCRLRQNELSVSDLSLEKGARNNLESFRGNQIEMEFDIKADSNANFIIQVLKHEDSQEFTTIRFDYSVNKIILDRRQSSLAATRKDTRIGDFVFNPADTLNVRIFIDHSILEVFVQNLTVFSARVYPTRAESDRVDVVAVDGQVTVVNARKWDMAAMAGHEVMEVACPPAHLPDAFNKLPVIPDTEEPLGSGQRTGWRVYPNPSRDGLLQVHGAVAGTFRLTDLSGQTLRTGAFAEGAIDLAASGLSNGMYILLLEHQGIWQQERILIQKL